MQRAELKCNLWFDVKAFSIINIWRVFVGTARYVLITHAMCNCSAALAIASRAAKPETVLALMHADPGAIDVQLRQSDQNLPHHFSELLS